MTIVDFAYARGAGGVYDIAFSGGGIVATGGLESAVFNSLFSDRRAYADEVADPLKRRGWIGDTVAHIAGDRFGSGLWLYEQSRLTIDVEAGVRLAAVQALQWLVDEQIASNVEADTALDRAERRLTLNVTITAAGGPTNYAYTLFSATQEGILQK